MVGHIPLTVALVKVMVVQDARLWVKEINTFTCISECSVQTILKNSLHLRKFGTRLVPHSFIGRSALYVLGKRCKYKYCYIHIAGLYLIFKQLANQGASFEPQRRADNKHLKLKEQN